MDDIGDRPGLVGNDQNTQNTLAAKHLFFSSVDLLAGTKLFVKGPPPPPFPRRLLGGGGGDGHLL